MGVWAREIGLDTGFEVRVLGWSSGPCHKVVVTTCRSAPRMEVWALEGDLDPGVEV